MMADRLKSGEKKLEDYEPGITRVQVLKALKKATKTKPSHKSSQQPD